MRTRQAVTHVVQGLSLEGINWPGTCPSAPRRILALHGWLDNAESFTPIAQQLPDAHIVAMDLPGHGRSDHRSADASYHFIDWVSTVVGILDSLAWSDAVLMGHSMGAGAAMLTAAVRPERVRSLVLIDALAPYTAEPELMPERLARHLDEVQRRSGRGGMRPYRSIEQAVASLCRVVPLLSADHATLLVRRNMRAVDGGWVWRGDPRLRGTSVLTLTESQLHAFLRRVVCPALFIRAPDGFKWDEQRLETHAALIAHLETVFVDGGHHVHMEQADKVGQYLKSWLGRCWPIP